MEFSNIYTLFRSQAAKYRDLPVFYTREGDGWSSQTWNDFEEQVINAACGLLAKGLTKGASVAILAGNIPEWSIIDIATIAAGGVGVGVYPTSSPEQCEYIINHSDAEFVFVDTVEQLEKVLKVRAALSNVKEIVLLNWFRKIGELDKSLYPKGLDAVSVNYWHDFYMLGKANRERLLPTVKQLGTSATLDDIAIMVYTSGTTGEPKGAMLSHRYILNSVESLRQSSHAIEGLNMATSGMHSGVSRFKLVA